MTDQELRCSGPAPFPLQGREHRDQSLGVNPRTNHGFDCEGVRLPFRLPAEPAQVGLARDAGQNLTAAGGAVAAGRRADQDGGCLNADASVARAAVLLRYVARRPVVQDNFGDDVGTRNFARAEAYFSASSEPEALRIAEALRVRYVLVRSGGSGHGRGYAPNSMFKRLHRLRGAAGEAAGSDGGVSFAVPSLVHHRLIFEARARDPRAGATRPDYKIFEIVPGARVSGLAAPGKRVTVRLPIGVGSQRFVYETGVRADSEGRYALILPYPNRSPTADVTPAPQYQLNSGKATAGLVVSESAVRSGARLNGPTLAP